LYRWLAESGSLEAWAYGLAGLIRLNDAGALFNVERSLDASFSRDAVRVVALSIETFYRSSGPNAAVPLGRMTATPSIPYVIRLASARALASIHSAPALPYLAALLDDPDLEMASCGVGGLAMFANNVAPITVETVRQTGYQPRPGPAPFRTQETMPARTSHSTNV
jgi:hypothetical protein